MINKLHLRVLISFALIFSLFTISLPQVGFAQTSAAKAEVSSDLQKRLARIEQKVEARRKELGIPGMSLAIVKDGKVVLSQGFGYKNFEKQFPVTGDTQFAIGSATKAFTALSVLMSQDQGKLSLEDSPKKYIPYFKINDSEIDKKITIRDLLRHSSGLNRTDLGWITGNLTREEIIKVAGEAKPTAKLGETFQYQNVMFLAAGEVVAKVQNKTWEAYVAQNILKPLGMLNSNVSVAEMQKAKDYSNGYVYNFDTKETKLLPTRDLGIIAPAGSINSSSNDMAKWLQFILNKGKVGEKRLISEKSFEEWTKPQQNISPNGEVSYGLGWFVQKWKDKKVIQHGGNIDGFNSMVALLPEENLGFVMLTNVSASTLGNELMPLIWETMTSEFKEESNQVASDDAKKEVGKYRFAAAGFDIDVKIEDGKFVAVVPGQPTYILAKVEGRKYKLTNAPDGFFITFKDNEAYLEQPQGNFTLPKVGAEKDEANSSDSAKELVGKYESEQNKGATIDIKEVDGKVSLVVGDQPPYPLVEKEKDVFNSPKLPDSYAVKVKRSEDGKLSGIMLIQPEGEFPFNFIGKTNTEENPKKIYGSYKLEQPPAYTIEISAKDGKMFLQVPDQPIYELEEKEKDVYFSPTIPDTLKKIEVKRDAEGNVIGLVSNEPGGTYKFKRIKVEKPTISVDELMAKTIEALGGKENWKKLNSRYSKAEIDFVHQGLKGTAIGYSKAPNAYSSTISITALGKEIGTIYEYFDGTKGGEDTSFSEPDTYTGQTLEDARFNSDFYGFINWKDKLKNAEVVKFDEVDGEKVYVISIEPKKASKMTYYISAKTFLPLKRRRVVSSSTSPQRITLTETYADYRKVDGVMIPFKTTVLNPGMGEIISYTKEVKHNVKIDDEMFQAKEQ